MNFRLASVLLVGLLGGCSRESAYRSVVRDQAAALEEMTGILKTVRDEATMEAAREKLLERHGRFAAIAKRALDLGPPPPEISERLRDESEKLALAFTRFRAEFRRVSALPGGAEFVKSFELSK